MTASGARRLRHWAFHRRVRYNQAMEFISEPISPLAGTFDTRVMSRGEPGLPAGFTRAGQVLGVVSVLQAWKESSREGGVGEWYLRRHYYRLRMSDGSTWLVYFIRQSPMGSNRGPRWFLYGIESPADGKLHARQPMPLRKASVMPGT